MSDSGWPQFRCLAIPEKSIAVLPFADLSEKKDQEYFSDGLSEELLDLLAQVPDLRVPARTSSFFFRGKDIAVADIANHKDAWDIGLEQAGIAVESPGGGPLAVPKKVRTGKDKAALVALDKIAEPLGARLRANENEKA